MDTAPPGTTSSPQLTRDELQLATRNHGMPLEALVHDRTPVGLHYLLIHYDIPVLDEQAWRLRIDGLVDQVVQLGLEDLRDRDAVTLAVTLECAGNGRARLEPRAISQPWLHEAVGTAEWTGVPLAEVLAEAGIAADATEVVFTGADRGVEGGITQAFQRSLSLSDALEGDALLAYAVNGEPLPPQHGFPVRLVVPGWYGMASVKWLVQMTAVAEPFDGYQQARAYRWRERPDEEGKPLDRVAVRSLMVPPGIPDFLTRRRFVDAGDTPITLTGRAWSGHGAVTAVEVSDDDGATWQEASVEPASGRYDWHRWTFAWQPGGQGEHTLACRATDAAGGMQPLEPVWNLGGYAVNAVQRVPVTVR